MKTISKILSVVLCLSVIIGLFVVGASAADTYVKVTDGNLTSGEYVIVCSNGVAMGKLDGTWITTADPTISGDSVTDAKGAVWTLTVDGDKVSIVDASGNAIAPKAGNQNGIQGASYSWKWTFANGEFTFAGVDSDTTLLASNVGSDNKFRAYKTSTVGGNPAGYPSTFTLYKKADAGSVTPPETEATTPSTEATTPSTEATTPSTEATTPSTEAVLKNGDKVVIYAPAYNKALSSLPASEGSFYQLGVDVTVSNGVMSGYGDTEVWTVVDNGDGTFSFEQGGQKLAMAAEYSSMKLGEVNDKWTITSVGTDVYNITNSARGNSIEWYNSKNNWSTYNKNTTTDDQFFMSFYVVSTTSTPEASEPSTEATTPVAPAPTGDASFVSVAVAAVVLSALAGTALVLKKKEN